VLPLKGTAAVSGPVASSIFVELPDARLFIPQEWRVGEISVYRSISDRFVPRRNNVAATDGGLRREIL